MSTPTHFLSVLVVVCSAVPSQLFRVGAIAAGAGNAAAGPGNTAAGAGRPAGGSARGRTAVPGWLVAPTLITALAALVWFVAPRSGVVAAPSAWWWCAVAVVVGALAPVVEFGVGALPAVAARRPVAGFRLHERAGGALGSAVPTAVAVAVAEEVIFRGVSLHLLATGLGWPPLAAIGLTALLYGLNHLWYGWPTVAQKTGTGLVYGALYVLAGYSVVVPVVAHVTQNLVVLLAVPRQAVRP
nr:CPBP family glutamic-type intramembrane protease [Micromonospora sp. DSM 115978]